MIDLRDEFRNRQSRGAISRQLHRAIDAALKDDGQVILLLNRRGYSTHIQCPACGLVLRCPHCELSLTHHLEGEVAICHYCDYQTAAPAKCPECTFRGHPLQRRGDAAAGGRSAGTVSRRARAADGHRHDAKAGEPRSERSTLSPRRVSTSCWARR